VARVDADLVRAARQRLAFQQRIAETRKIFQQFKFVFACLPSLNQRAIKSSLDRMRRDFGVHFKTFFRRLAADERDIFFRDLCELNKLASAMKAGLFWRAKSRRSFVVKKCARSFQVIQIAVRATTVFLSAIPAWSSFIKSGRSGLAGSGEVRKFRRACPTRADVRLQIGPGFPKNHVPEHRNGVRPTKMRGGP